MIAHADDRRVVVLAPARRRLAAGLVFRRTAGAARTRGFLALDRFTRSGARLLADLAGALAPAGPFAPGSFVSSSFVFLAPATPAAPRPFA